MVEISALRLFLWRTTTREVHWQGAKHYHLTVEFVCLEAERSSSLPMVQRSQGKEKGERVRLFFAREQKREENSLDLLQPLKSS